MRIPYIVLAVACIAPGCTRLLGLDETSLSENDASTPTADATMPTADASSTPDAGPTFECIDTEFAPSIGTQNVDTETLGDRIALSCGAGNSNDQRFSWKAPATDYYIFDTDGSGFDTALALFSDCDGTEVACNNNIDGDTLTSRLVTKIERDTELMIAVDGVSGDQGQGSLNVSRVSCPDSDLEGQTLPAQLSTSGFADDHMGTCGGDGHEDRAYHWVAPNDGLFAFTAIANGYRTVLSLIDGPECSNAELGCNSAWGNGMRSEVVRRLAAGTPVSIYVDGYNGDGGFEIDIEDRSQTTCPEHTGPAPDGMVSHTYSDRLLSSSCSFPEVSDGIAGSEILGDTSYLITVPPPGLGCERFCTVFVESAGEFSVALLDTGDCSGQELDCQLSSGPSPAASVQVGAVGSEESNYTLIVSDRLLPSGETVTVRMMCQAVCA